MAQGAGQDLIGLDLNSARLRAMAGPAGAPATLCLDEPRAELPLAISLEGRHPEVGLAGVRLCRQLPHLACVDFLPHLGESRQWSAGRHRLDAVHALGLVLKQLAPVCARAAGLVLSVPAYLSDSQMSLVTQLCEQSRLCVLGVLAAPLTAAVAAHAEQPWSGPALVLDADQYALSAAVVAVENGQAQLLDVQVYPELGVRAWKDRLLDAVADQAIRQTRRDLRESALAEQSVYEQLDDALDACRKGELVQLAIQAPQWFQNLMLRPDDLASFCAPLVRQVLAAVRPLRATPTPGGAVKVVLLTATAGCLPGLTAALEAEIEDSLADDPEEVEDFGEGLGQESFPFAAGVHVLRPEALARAAHELAGRIARGELPCGDLVAVPLSAPPPLDAGPARLQFRGKDHLLTGLCFMMGRQRDCNLVFDSEEYPGVSGYHCEIVYDRRAFHLYDRSRNGTLVNDRPVTQAVVLEPGDWIRLGPGGPLLRFLGRAADQLKLMTTA
jgi:hypothetical protein